MEFLRVENVVRLHKRQLDLYGGLDGIRDYGLLESAVNAPIHTACYDATASIYLVAACYAYHISKNQAFNDGNKRTGVVCTLAFLKLNGVAVVVPEKTLFKLTEQLATGETSKRSFAAYLAATEV